MIARMRELFRPWPYILVPLFIAGAAVRGMLYAHDSALWLDEAWVALDILNRSAYEIVTSEGYAKPVPIGFALLVKLFVSILGSNEYVFRLVPFVAGLVSLVLYLKFLQRFADPKAIPIAYGLFIFCEPLIYYCAELKYYSSDVMIVLALYLIAFVRSGISDTRPMIIYAVTAALAVWFSHTSLFIILSIAVIVFCRCWQNTETRNRFFAIQSLWVLSFAFVYLVSLEKVEHLGGIHSMWEKYFWPWPAWQQESLVWLRQSFEALFTYPGGFNFPFLAGALFVAGAVVVGRRDKYVLGACLLPFAVVLLASGLRKYPFSGRLLLFLVPLILYFIGEGLSVLFNRGWRMRIIGVIVTVCLVFYPVKQAVSRSISPIPKEDIRPVVRFLEKYQQEGDEMGINNSAIFPLLYYVKLYNFPLKARIGKVWMDDLAKDQEGAFVLWAPTVFFAQEALNFPAIEIMNGGKLTQESGQERVFGESPRLWIILSHAGAELEDYLIKCLDAAGQRRIELKTRGGSAYLFYPQLKAE